jgi:hypothetical protein
MKNIYDWIVAWVAFLMLGIFSHVLWILGFWLFSAVAGGFDLFLLLGMWLHYIGEI